MALEDALQDLKKQRGTQTHVSDWLEVTQEKINLFARATGDHQWIHVDVARATEESPFQSPVAHGFLTLALLPYLSGAGEKVGAQWGAKLGVNYGSNRLRFPHPVVVGAKVRLRSVLQSVEEVPGQNCLQLITENTIELADVEKPACVVESITRMYF